MKSWALLDELTSGYVFGSEEALRLPEVDGTRLAALPLSPDELGLQSRRINTNSGRPISVLASFAYSDGQWVAQDPLRIEIPFALADCASDCLKQFECADCGVVPTTQGCSQCEPEAVVPPEQPSRDCPAGWQRSEEADGHFYCSADVSPQLGVPCGAGERWSVAAESCVAHADCLAPDNVPAGAVFVDPAAPAGGDGSAAMPFRSVPSFTPSLTVVLVPGSYSDQVVVDAPMVSVIGHGRCTRLLGRPHEDVVTVRSPDVAITGVFIEASGAGHALVLDSGATAAISATLIEAEGLAVSATGALSLDDVMIERTGRCDSDCSAQAAVVVSGPLTITNSDIQGPSAVVSEQGPLELRQTRLLSGSLGGIGLSQAGVEPVTVAEVAAMGFGMGFYFSAQSELRAELSDLVIRTSTAPDDDSESGRAVVFLANESLPSSLTIHRADIAAQRRGLFIEGAEVVLEDIRVDGARRSIERGPSRATSQLTARRLWLDASRLGLVELGRGLTVLEDVWFRGCRDCAAKPIGPFFGAAFQGPGRLQAHGLHILAGGYRAISNYDAIVVDDLTVREARALPPVRAAVNTRSSVEGARWDIEAQGIGLGIDGTFDVSNVRIVPDASPNELTPLCLYRLAQGRLRGFELVRTSSRSTVFVLEPAFRDLPVDTLRLESGRVLPGRLVEASDDCVGRSVALAELPVFDEVVQR